MQFQVYSREFSQLFLFRVLPGKYIVPNSLSIGWWGSIPSTHTTSCVRRPSICWEGRLRSIQYTCSFHTCQRAIRFPTSHHSLYPGVVSTSLCRTRLTEQKQQSDAGERISTKGKRREGAKVAEGKRKKTWQTWEIAVFVWTTMENIYTKTTGEKSNHHYFQVN